MRVPTWPRLLHSCLLAASVLTLTGVAAAVIPAPLPAEAAVTPPSVAVASMTTARAGHTATYLNSGLVLVAGGRGSAGHLILIALETVAALLQQRLDPRLRAVRAIA